jgi:hypothetical protein
MENLRFRAATIADIDCLLEMKAEYCNREDICFTTNEARDSLLGLLGSPAQSSIWFVQLDGSNVGYFILLFGGGEFTDRTAMVDELYVPVSIWTSDLTHKITSFAVQVCRSNGVRVFHERLGNQWYLKTTWL